MRHSTALHKKNYNTSHINLYKGKNRSFLDRFIKWSLSAGRLMIILTEIVALSAFLYRFSLDRQIIDLNDKIKYEENRLKSFKSSEEKYRSLQNRIATAGKLSDAASNTVGTFENFIAIIPNDMSYKNIQFSNSSLTIDGNIPTISSLTNFIKVLKQDPTIKTARLDRIENKISSSTIEFGLSVVFK